METIDEINFRKNFQSERIIKTAYFVFYILIIVKVIVDKLNSIPASEAPLIPSYTVGYTEPFSLIPRELPILIGFACSHIFVWLNKYLFATLILLLALAISIFGEYYFYGLILPSE